MSVNVNRNVDDVFYRYKMPKLLAKVEGKGNGIKTVIANMSEIAKALNRPPSYPTKYFGCELGAQTQMDLKNDRFIVNGAHESQKLQEMLDGFIKKFVLCPECDNPETTLTVKRNQILQRCKACGYSGTIDQRHKLSTFIVKNPPGQEGGTEGGTPTGVPSTKKDAKGSAKGKHADSPGTPTDEGVVVNGKGDSNGEVIAGGDKSSGSGSGGEEADEDTWDVNPDDLANRMESLTTGILGLTQNEDLEKSVEDRLDMFYNFLQKQKASGKFDEKLVVAEAERLDIKEKAMLLLCRLLLDNNILSQAKQYRNLFLRFTADNKRAQKYLLGGLEQVIVAHRDALMPKVVQILKHFYDLDILEEDVLKEWGGKSSKKYVSKEENKEVRAKAEPLLKWLDEAEEESDEEGLDDDGVEVVYETSGTGKGTRGPVSTAGTAQMNGNARSTATANEANKNNADIDIDDI